MSQLLRPLPALLVAGALSLLVALLLGPLRPAAVATAGSPAGAAGAEAPRPPATSVEEIDPRELSLNRQTRTVVARAGGAHRVELAAGMDRLLVGVAFRSVDSPAVDLVARSVPDGRVQHRRRVENDRGSNLWRDFLIEAPRATAVELALEPVAAGASAVLSRPARLRRAADASSLLAPFLGRRPRNLILISIDTLRADFLGLYGYERFPTSPSLDALGRRGTVFEWAIAPSSWTVPSHAAVLTGADPDALGMDALVFATPRVPRTLTTLAELFAQAGFLTVAFTGTSTMAAKNGFSDGFYLYQEANTRPIALHRDLDTNVFAARSWLASHAQQPFFLFFHTFEVHDPYVHSRFLRLDASHEEQERQSYASGIAYADEALGRFLRDLDELGLLAESLVVVMSDHGEGFNDHPDQWRHGRTLYEEVLRVPLLFQGPGIPVGRRVGQPVALRDLFATLVDLFALDGSEEIRARSFRPLLAGRGVPERGIYLCCMSHGTQKQGMRTSSYKYIFEPRPGAPLSFREELYDLRADPAERRDLAAVHPETAEALRGETVARTRANQAQAREQREDRGLDREYLEQLRALGYVE